MSSDAGVLLLGATDRKRGLLQAAAGCIADPHDPLLITYGVADLLRQRMYAAAILKLLVRRLRQSWPQVRIVFRGDSGFCRQRILNYCERAGVHYIVGLARYARLQQVTEFVELSLADDYQSSGLKQRQVGEFRYGAQSWVRQRRVITRLECGPQGANPRYVVISLTGDAQALYDDVYCQRGEAQNRIKQAQVGLFATRTSCQHFQGNQLRVLLAACPDVPHPHQHARPQTIRGLLQCWRTPGSPDKKSECRETCG